MARAPFAYWRPIPSKTDPVIEPIGVILHVDGGNARSLYHWFNGPSGGIESHFHVDRDGHTEQYRDTNQEADANYLGNSFFRNGKRVGFISVETQGYAHGEWTDAQLESIKRILTWVADTHPLVELREAPAWNEPGVGYHVMWGAPGAWTNASGKVCPGPDRINQFYDVIVPWMEDHMVSRHKPLDDGSTNTGVRKAFQRARQVGMYSEHTQPGNLVLADTLAAFLDRQGLLDYPATISKMRKQIAAAAGGGATVGAVIAEIVNRLS